MKRICLALSILLIAGCSRFVHQVPVPPAPLDVTLIIDGDSTRPFKPGETAEFGPGGVTCTLKFSVPVDLRTVQLKVTPETWYVQERSEAVTGNAYDFGLTPAGPEADVTVALEAVADIDHTQLIGQPTIFHLKLRRPAAPAPVVPTPVSGIHVWAVDPSGAREAEVLLTRPEPLFLAGVSPNGRHWLLAEMIEGIVGDPKGRLYLYDRETGQLRVGDALRLDPRAVAWSGSGFWIDWLVHLDLEFRVDTYAQLRKALNLGERQLLTASFAADGRKVAVLVRNPHNTSKTNVDLVLANHNGSDMRVVQSAIQPWWGKASYFSQLAMSPNGESVVLLSQSPGSAQIQVSDVARERWLPLLKPFVDPLPPNQPGAAPPGMAVWAPNGRWFWLPGSALISKSGESVKQLIYLSPWAVWNADGTALVVSGTPGTSTLKLIVPDGEEREFAVPPGTQPVGFLSDGRVLVFRTETP